jgi:hypothetical protein
MPAQRLELEAFGEKLLLDDEVIKLRSFHECQMPALRADG